MPDSDRLNQPQVESLLQRVRERIRLKHYSMRTEETYVDWINRVHPRGVAVWGSASTPCNPGVDFIIFDNEHADLMSCSNGISIG